MLYNISLLHIYFIHWYLPSFPCHALPLFPLPSGITWLVLYVTKEFLFEEKCYRIKKAVWKPLF